MPTDETMAPGAAYIAREVTCRACRAKNKAAAFKQQEEGDTHGTYWVVDEAPPL